MLMPQAKAISFVFSNTPLHSLLKAITRSFSCLFKCLPDHFISRKKLFSFLHDRYNYLPNSRQTVQEITLPHSKAKAKLVINNLEAEISSLLNDPRILEEDYLFFGNNPMNPPPANINYVGDLNTGRAYLETHKRLITPGTNQVLLPVLFYIDGANTGHFADLPITAVKFTFGIFTRKARDKEHMWRILGYVPAVSKHKSRGRRILIDSQHVDSVMAHQDALEDEGQLEATSVCKAQDLHTMLSVILADYVKLQSTGFYWELPYKNQVHKIRFVMFTPFFKVDGDEAEKICGKYTTRTGNVKQLCRYCKCPTPLSDRTLLQFEAKTPQEIEALRINDDDEGLKNLSQQKIINAAYALRFGKHNNTGVHGACPMEMLHAINLGIFRYIRDCFFEQVGATSKLADTINGYSREYGALFSRQSDRNFPKTKFANGIRRGKLMAKEYPGILLCMAVVLTSTGGSNELRQHKPSVFGQTGVIEDWKMLVVTLLQWEMWLKKDVMEKHHVQRARRKHRYLMYLIKEVGKRMVGGRMPDAFQLFG